MEKQKSVVTKTKMNFLQRVFVGLNARGYLRFVPDDLCLRILYRIHLHKTLDLEHPGTYPEKLQWLKLHDRKPFYPQMVDKFEAKKYVANIIGEEYIIPTYGVWDRFEDIDFELLPDQFVLKCTHDSGSVVICKDKTALDIKAVKARIEKSLKRNYFWLGREWPYKNVKPRIMAEKYMEDEKVHDLQNDKDVWLTNYNFFCFNGKPMIMYISQDKSQDVHTDFFDMQYRHLPIRMKDPNSQVPPEKPETFEKMKELATVLCEGHQHLRVDFYNSGRKIYFGELTFYHFGGFANVYPEEWNLRLGKWIATDRLC